MVVRTFGCVGFTLNCHQGTLGPSHRAEQRLAAHACPTMHHRHSPGLVCTSLDLVFRKAGLRGHAGC